MTTSREQARGEGNCEGANELAHLRRTAAALLCVEPTRPDPHARWSGEGARRRASLPDLCQICLAEAIIFRPAPATIEVLNVELHVAIGFERFEHTIRFCLQ